MVNVLHMPWKVILSRFLLQFSDEDPDGGTAHIQTVIDHFPRPVQHDILNYFLCIHEVLYHSLREPTRVWYSQIRPSGLRVRKHSIFDSATAVDWKGRPTPWPPRSPDLTPLLGPWRTSLCRENSRHKLSQVKYHRYTCWPGHGKGSISFGWLPCHKRSSRWNVLNCKEILMILHFKTFIQHLVQLNIWLD